MDRYPSNLPITEHSYRRVEVLTGTPRRRRWTAQEKERIVAESSEPGVVARSVALRHGVHPNQLYAWRREFQGLDGVAGSELAGEFVPVTLSDKAPGRGAGAVEIALSGAVLRAAPGV